MRTMIRKDPDILYFIVFYSFIVILTVILAVQARGESKVKTLTAEARTVSRSPWSAKETINWKGEPIVIAVYDGQETLDSNMNCLGSLSTCLWMLDFVDAMNQAHADRYWKVVPRPSVEWKENISTNDPGLGLGPDGNCFDETGNIPCHEQ